MCLIAYTIDNHIKCVNLYVDKCTLNIDTLDMDGLRPCIHVESGRIRLEIANRFIFRIVIAYSTSMSSFLHVHLWKQLPCGFCLFMARD